MGRKKKAAPAVDPKPADDTPVVDAPVEPGTEELLKQANAVIADIKPKMEAVINWVNETIAAYNRGGISSYYCNAALDVKKLI